ncbi:MAG: hypothetical protein AAF529_03165 [Pseudomonadota bacterium]
MNTRSHRRGWLRSLRRTLLAGALAGLAQFAYAESEYAAAWGPSVGADVPMLSALDQNEKPQTLETLKGSNGLLFVFNRSVDW